VTGARIAPTIAARLTARRNLIFHSKDIIEVGLSIADCRLSIADCRLSIADCRLSIADCRFEI